MSWRDNYREPEPDEYVALPPGFWFNDRSDFCPDMFDYAIVGKYSEVIKKYYIKKPYNIKKEHIFKTLEEAQKVGEKMTLERKEYRLKERMKK